MRLIKSAGVAATIGLLYPRMMPIHTFTDDIGFRGENGRVTLPPSMRASYARMEPHGAYLIGTFLAVPTYSQRIDANLHVPAAENGEIAILWLGSSVSPQILQDLYAVENLEELDVRMVGHPVYSFAAPRVLMLLLAWCAGEITSLGLASVCASTQCPVGTRSAAGRQATAYPHCETEYRRHRGGIFQHAGRGCQQVRFS